MKKTTIALADDYSIYREGLQVTLSADDTLDVIIEADNGKELLEKMENRLPDIVIIDYKMPEMDGMEATRLIKQRYPAVKVLVISMYHDQQFINHLMDNGADAYLLKDAEPEEILEAVNKLRS